MQVHFRAVCVPEDPFIPPPQMLHRTVAPTRHSKGSAFSDTQAARIGRLLDELRTHKVRRRSWIGHPFIVRCRLKKARKILGQWPEALRRAQPIDGEEDPQPESTARCWSACTIT